MAIKKLVIYILPVIKIPSLSTTLWRKSCNRVARHLFSEEGPAKLGYAVAAWCGVKVKDLINIGCCRCDCHYLVLSLQQQIIIKKDMLTS